MATFSCNVQPRVEHETITHVVSVELLAFGPRVGCKALMITTSLPTVPYTCVLLG